MPELPEVETVRRGVATRTIGRRIDHTVVTGARTVRRSSAEEIRSATRGRTVTGAGRHGKWLWLVLDDDSCVLVHLRMSGQLLWSRRGDALPPHTHVRFVFAGGDELRFVDPRTFGEVIVLDTVDDALELIAQGPDALAVTAEESVERLAHRRRAAKAVLLDQKTLAGVGNIYADEILHRAGVRPTRSNLTKPAARRVHEAIGEVLGAAIDARGSSLADAQYVDLEGRVGEFQHQHKVHARDACGSCGAPVRRIVLGGRSAYYCPSCQR